MAHGCGCAPELDELTVDDLAPWGRCECGDPSAPNSNGYCNSCRVDDWFYCSDCGGEWRKRGVDVDGYVIVVEPDGRNAFRCHECSRRWFASHVSKDNPCAASTGRKSS